MASKKTKKAGGKRVRKPSAKTYLERLQTLTPKGEDPFVLYSDDSDVIPVVDEFVSTGSIAVDRQLGGGWPIGAISELRAWEGVGKSTLADQSLAHMQRVGGISALIDTEKSRDREWTQRLGVDLSKLLLKPCDTLEQAFDAIDAILSVQSAVKAELNKGRSKKKREIKPPPMLIVWDSLGATPTKVEFEGDSDDNHVGVAARRIKQNLRRLTQRLYRLRAGLVIVNHVYQTIGGFGSLVSPGGGGIRYAPHVRIHMSRKQALRIGDTVVGHEIEVKNLKNRIVGNQEPVTAALIYGMGIDNAYTIYEWGKKPDVGPPWIVQQGQWHWLYPPGEDPIPFQRQYLGLSEILKQRPDIYQRMYQQYMSRLHAKKEESKEEN